MARAAVQYALVIIPRSVLLKIINVLDRICRENGKAFCIQQLSFFENCAFLG